MNDMLRFTERARRVLTRARESAESFQHNYIGTEHLLFGLMSEEGSVAGRVLHSFDIDTEEVKALVLETVKSKPRNATHLEFSLRSRRVLELAAHESEEMHQHFIGTEHLLLGMLRQQESTAVNILQQLGIDIDQLRQQTRSAALLKPTPVADPFPEFSTERVRVLDMIERGSITFSEGKQLLHAMLPSPTALTIGPEANVADIGTLKLRMRVSDRETGETQLEFSLPFAQLQRAVTEIAHSAAVDGERRGRVLESSETETYKIEAFLDEEKST